MGDAGLTQSLTVAAMGIVMLLFDVLVFGQVIDLFVDLGHSLPIGSIPLQSSMAQILVFGNWFYTIVFILGWCFIAYPIIFIIKRHRYTDIEETSMSEETNMGGMG